MDTQNPYSPPEVNVDKTPEESFRYVGFWSRTVAVIVDSLLMMVILVPLLMAIYGEEFFYSDTMIQGPAHFFLSYIMPAIAVILFWIYKSATPGKMVISAKIVDASTGNPPSKQQLIIRYLGYYLSTIPLMLGFIWAAFDARKQGWHDKVANTVVVRGK